MDINIVQHIRIVLSVIVPVGLVIIYPVIVQLVWLIRYWLMGLIQELKDVSLMLVVPCKTVRNVTILESIMYLIVWNVRRIVLPIMAYVGYVSSHAVTVPWRWRI